MKNFMVKEHVQLNVVRFMFLLLLFCLVMLLKLSIDVVKSTAAGTESQPIININSALELNYIWMNEPEKFYTYPVRDFG